MSWWDGLAMDRVRVLRNSLRVDRNHLANAPLSPSKKRKLQESIVGQEDALSRLLALKRKSDKRRKEQRKH